MNVGKLQDSYPNLTAIQIVDSIAAGRIGGMWLTKHNVKEAQDKNGSLTEDEATQLLLKFDEDRQYGFNYWNMFN